MRLFRREQASYSGLVHEGPEFPGTVGKLTHPLWHQAYDSLEQFISKQDRYSTLAAGEMYQRGKHASVLDLLAQPSYAFFKHYILQAGFRDGVAGVVVCSISTCYVFLKYAKLYYLCHTVSPQENCFDRAKSELDWDQIRRILLIRLRSIGDTVLITPCLTALKSWRPELEIDVLLEPLSAPILRHHPLVTAIQEIPMPHSTVVRQMARGRMLIELRARHYDLAINLHGGTTSMFLTYLTGARTTVALANLPGANLMSVSVPAPEEIWQKTDTHTVENQLALLKWIGVPMPSPLPATSLALDPQAVARTARLLAQAGIGREFALVHPATALPAKQWDPLRFARAIDYLYQRYRLPSLLVALPSQQATLETIMANISVPAYPFIDLPLEDTMALIANATLFLGIDSGPAHIAAALARPLVVIFGLAITIHHWRPWATSLSRMVCPAVTRAELCPSRPSKCANICESLECIKLISVEQVIAAIDELLSGR